MVAKQVLIYGLLWMSLASQVLAAEHYMVHSFQKVQLSDQFLCEGANFGDFNHDEVMDIVAGPYWYAGPDFTERHEYYKAKVFDVSVFSDNFFAFPHDVNQDGWTDIVMVGFPGKEAWWFANPQGKSERWDRHLIMKVVDNESPTLTDLTGDGRPELVCCTGGQLGYAEMPIGDPTQPWPFHSISPNRGYQRFTHGLGIGDVNGDGRLDVLEKDGWWEQPAATAKVEFWPLHEVEFSKPRGGAQMFAFDVDGDGDHDVVTSKNAHGYGLSWFENVAGPSQPVKFKEHRIMGNRPEQNEYGVVFSRLHAVDVVDMDHDGVLDIVTGLRHSASLDRKVSPSVIYWFQTTRQGGKTRFIPHRVDANSGVGTQVVAGDLNGDKWPDIVVANKQGTFVFIHHTQEVDQKTWEAAQPVPTARRNTVPRGGRQSFAPTGEPSAVAGIDSKSQTIRTSD
ncbi:MAG: VCBS repeat-containing protein [Pirellulales bacterium]